MKAKHCEELYRPSKKYIRNSGFWSGIFSQIPIAHRGFWKSPRAARRALGAERRPDRGAAPLSAVVLPEGISKTPEQAMGIWLKIPDQKPEFRIYFFIAHYNFTQCFACKTTYSANFTLKCNMHSSIHNLNHLRFLNLILFYISTFSHLLTFYTPETQERALLYWKGFTLLFYQNFTTNMTHPKRKYYYNLYYLLYTWLRSILTTFTDTINYLISGDFKPGILSRGF